MTAGLLNEGLPDAQSVGCGEGFELPEFGVEFLAQGGAEPAEDGVEFRDGRWRGGDTGAQQNVAPGAHGGGKKGVAFARPRNVGEFLHRVRIALGQAWAVGSGASQARLTLGNSIAANS